MKNNPLFLLIPFFIFSSCAKEKGCTQQDPSLEKTAIVDFCASNTITYTQDPSGIFYQIITPGTGTQPTTSSRVFMYYTGKYLNGTIFDQLSDPTRSGWTLSSLIEGWKIGIPLIKKGGRIKLIIPSALAYGCTGYASIPPNTPLYFDVTLTDVQ
jgi:FKBP-type peptidyl-prolyl cis-trans isomerase FkpA